MCRRAIAAAISHSQCAPLLHFSRPLSSRASGGGGECVDDDPPYADVPSRSRRKSERKPYPTPMKVLIERAKAEREARKAHPCRMLEDPPENGLLLPHLLPVAHGVYHARHSLLLALAKLLQIVPVKRCRCCSEVHIGHVGHEIRTCSGPNSSHRCGSHHWKNGAVQDVISFPECYHLSDRVGRPRIGHDERLTVPRLPAVVELCVQAGLELETYPTRRRTHPVYCIEGRIVDFELERTEGNVENLSTKNADYSNYDAGSGIVVEVGTGPPDIEKLVKVLEESNNECRDSLMELSAATLDSWFKMVSGAKKLMEKYRVHTCGYCAEVQVGPKGHKVRMCKGTKHQSRNGLHAWQEATIDDLIGLNYVWHVRDLYGPPLLNSLKRYYGKAPALVELCVQGGAPVPDEYKSMMRLEVVPPDRDEVDLVA